MDKFLEIYVIIPFFNLLLALKLTIGRAIKYKIFILDGNIRWISTF